MLSINVILISFEFLYLIVIVSSSMVVLLALHIIAFMFPEQLTVFVLMDPRNVKEFFSINVNDGIDT